MGGLMDSSQQDSNSSVADALLSEARLSGRRAAMTGISRSANPHPADSASWREWDLGHSGYVTEQANAAVYEGKVCMYAHGKACDCGGRGLCLDVA